MSSIDIVQPTYPPLPEAYTPRPLDEVTELIIHHSASPLTTTPTDIDAEHRAQGWNGIGYHYVIAPTGIIYAGRPITVVPSAAEGSNTVSVDVCLIGNFQTGDAGYTGVPTPAQLSSLVALGTKIHELVPSISRTIGHRDVNATACPGQALYDEIPNIRVQISNLLLVQKAD